MHHSSDSARIFRRFCCLAVLLLHAAAGIAKSPPLSIDELRASEFKARLAPDSSRVPKQVVDGLERDIAALDGPFDWRGSEPLRHLHYLTTPLILHHALGDRGAPYEWSARLAKELYLRSYRYEFYSYPGNDHLFRGASLEEAAERDAAFFRSLIKPRSYCEVTSESLLLLPCPSRRMEASARPARPQIADIK